MRSFSLLVLLGALGVLPAIGCSSKADLEKAQTDLQKAREEAKQFKAEADRLRAELELLKKAAKEAEKPNPPPAKDYAGIPADAVAAWEKAGAKFGWLTTNKPPVRLSDELPLELA